MNLHQCFWIALLAAQFGCSSSVEEDNDQINRIDYVILASEDDYYDEAGKDIQEVSEERFDKFYDKLVEKLNEIGTFSDGGIDEGDFASSRFVSPVNSVTITAESESAFSSNTIEKVIEAIEEDGNEFSVVFDFGVAGVVVRPGPSVSGWFMDETWQKKMGVPNE